jgi:zeta-carotene desaturase
MAVQKTALIAGGGLAGLTAAILLDELGFQVTLIERKPILGGRTFSYTDRTTGQTIDNGQHIMIGAYHHTFNLLEKIGAKHKVEMLQPTHIPLVDGQGKKNTLKIGLAKPPWNLFLGLAQFEGLSFSDKIRLIGLILPIDQMKHKHLTVLEWLKLHKQSPDAIKNFWEPLTLATLNDAPANTTVDGLLQVIKKSYFAGKNDGFLVLPQEGLSQVFAEPARRYLELRGCRIMTGVGVEGIDVLGDRVASFCLSDNTKLTADIFVSSLPPWDLGRILPDNLRDSHPQLKHTRDMTGSPVVAVDLFFDRPVMRERFVGLTNAQTHWFFNHSVIARSAEGRPWQSTSRQHISAIISAAHDVMNKDKQTILDIVLKDFLRSVHCVQRVPPVHASVHKIEKATLASQPGINAFRPEQKILNNFFVIGDWTKTDLPATIESAVKSAFMMSPSLRGSS